MQPVLSDVLARRRDRSIAIVLGVKERECDEYLPRDASAKLRKVVLDQLNEYHDFVMDVCKSLDDDSHVLLNELYMDKIDAMYESMVQRRIMIAESSNGTS